MICQNEEKLNSARGPVTHKVMHDSLSRVTACLVGVDDRSANKERARPTRSEAKVESLAGARKPCRIRALLETGRRFFNNETEVTFAQSITEAEMSLTDREKTYTFSRP